MVVAQAGADVNAASDEKGGETPLLCACRDGREACARLLVENGAKIRLAAFNTWTPLHCACAMGQEACARLLIANGADVNRTNMYGDTSLYKACVGGHVACVQLLVKSGADVNKAIKGGKTPLHAASRLGLETCVRWLVDAGANVNGADKRGRTPLHKACTGCRETCVQLLVEAGAYVGRADNKGETPLHMACEKGNGTCVRLLVEAGADVNQASEGDQTPLHKACSSGSEACVRLLLAHNAVGRLLQLQTCSLDTAQAVGANSFVQSVEVAGSELEDKHLALMWASPSLKSVKDAVHAYERPRGLMTGQFVEGEMVHVLDTPGRWVVEHASEHQVERLKHASEGDRFLINVPFENVTAAHPGWHEVDLARARGAQCICVDVLKAESLGWVLRRRIEGYLW